MPNREKVFNNVILVGSSNDACSLAAVVGRCPALGIALKALLGEFPQVLVLGDDQAHEEFGNLHLIYFYSIMEELTCNIKREKTGMREREKERERERERGK